MNKNNKSGKVIEAKIYIEDVILTIMWDDGFYDYERPGYDYNKDYQIPLHFHEYYEITYNGHRREFIFEDNAFTAEEGHLIIIPPKLLHVQRVAENSYNNKGSSYSLLMKIQKNKIKTPSSLYDILYAAIKNIYYEKVPQRVAEIMEILDIDNPRTITNSQVRFSLILHELIALIIESSKIRSSDEIYRNSFDSSESRIYKIEAMINENYSDNLSLDQISQKINISPRQIARIIKKQYGCTFKEILTTKRINRAKHLLRNTDKKISDISTEVGYNSEKTFYNAFVSKCGCSPSEYKKHMRNQGK